MVSFLDTLHRQANVERAFCAAGGPWEFNLRDLLRWCQLAQSAAAAAHEHDGGADELSDGADGPAKANSGCTNAIGDGVGVDAAGSGAGSSGGSGQGGGGGDGVSAATLEAAVEHFVGMLFVQRLRTDADRQHVRALFARVWGRPLSESPRPALLLSPERLRIGWARLARADRSTSGSAASGGGSSPDTNGSAEALQLLAWQAPLLESAAQAAAQGWMTLLVGPGGGGKTSLARALAACCGQTLQVGAGVSAVGIRWPLFSGYLASTAILAMKCELFSALQTMYLEAGWS